MRTAGLLWALWLFAPAPDLMMVELKPGTVAAFDQYVRKTEARLDHEREVGPFLWTDGTPGLTKRVQDGELMAVPAAASGDVEVPDGMIHDWQGAVFIPHATLAQVLKLLQDYDHHKVVYRPEVQDSRTIEHHGNDFQVFLRLLKRQVLTVVLDTTHEVHYAPVSATRWYSRSHSVRIAEVDKANTPAEHELPPGQDHGFIWRLNSYWRFEERDGGVYVETEAISLSREVPAALRWLIDPMIRTLPKDSLTNTLRDTRDALK